MGSGRFVVVEWAVLSEIQREQQLGALRLATPDGPALALLQVAAKNPEAVAEALQGKRGTA